MMNLNQKRSIDPAPLKNISVAVRVRIRVSGGCPRPAAACPPAPEEPPLLLDLLRKLCGPPGELEEEG